MEETETYPGRSEFDKRECLEDLRDGKGVMQSRTRRNTAVCSNNADRNYAVAYTCLAGRIKSL